MFTKIIIKQQASPKRLHVNETRHSWVSNANNQHSGSGECAAEMPNSHSMLINCTGLRWNKVLKSCTLKFNDYSLESETRGS